MSNPEIIQPKSKIDIIPINDLDTLRQLCLDNAYVTNNLSIKACPGLFMKEVGKALKKRPINGVYGLEKLDPNTKESVAFCGFRIENEEMLISHTPQGKKPEKFSSSTVRNRFVRSNFRVEMMAVLIEMAKNLGLKRIIGYPAALFYEVDIGLISYEEAYKRMDALFQKMGFVFDEKRTVYCLTL
ncbi:MAG: hypothetical protein Fur009_7960 [Candidatus Microgenomates bacterium]